MHLLQMWVKQTHIGHKWQVHGSQNIWYTKHKHMGHNTYGTQNNQYIMLIFTSFSTWYFLHIKNHDRI
jgi:hypothetical protein